MECLGVSDDSGTVEPHLVNPAHTMQRLRMELALRRDSAPATAPSLASKEWRAAPGHVVVSRSACQRPYGSTNEVGAAPEIDPEMRESESR